MRTLRIAIVGVVLVIGASGGLSGGQIVQPMQDPIQPAWNGWTHSA